MRRKIIAVVGILLILGVVVTFKFIKKSPPKTEEVHYHAGFVVFKDGQKIDFSDSKYMYIKPCNVDENKKEDDKTIQMEKAHLHDGVGDVVHIEADGATWGDLFTNINYTVDYASVSAFINGSKIDGIKNTPIKSYDSLVLFEGKPDETKLNQNVSIDRIKEVERKSIECGK